MLLFVGSLVLLLFVIGTISIFTVQYINKIMTRIVEHKEPLAHDAYEMEINLLENCTAVMGYLHTSDSSFLKKLEVDRIHFKKYYREYMNEVEGENEKKVSYVLDSTYKHFDSIAQFLILSHDNQNKIMDVVAHDFRYIDSILDEKIQIFEKNNGHSYLKKVYATLEMEININGIAKGLGKFLMTGDSIYIERINDDTQDFLNAFNTYKTFPLSKNEKKWIKIVREIFNKDIELIHEIVEAKIQTKKGLMEYSFNYRELDNILDDEIQTSLTSELGNFKAAAKNAISKLRITLIGVMLVSIALSLIVWFFFSRTVINPIKKMFDMTDRISMGDFNGEIDIESKDEIGALVNKFNTMILERRKIADIEKKIKSELEERVKERTLELSSANKKLRDEIEYRKKIEIEQARLQEMLCQSQKLEAIGKLAGGIAHDFNNMLTVINGYCEILLGQTKLDNQQSEIINDVHNAGKKSQDLTRQLLAFGRRQVIKKDVININDLIGNFDKMLSRIVGEDVEIIIELDENLKNVNVDGSQIEQIILNLVVNARDALSNGGEIIIETSNIYLSNEYTRDHDGMIPGNYVMLAISDNGMGMDHETRNHIFEPFYTTKKYGRGTGLGLSTVYGIVKQLGGNIWCYSELNNGTTFKIYLPSTDSDIVKFTTKSKPDISKICNLNLIVVEDEESLRKLMSRMLKSIKCNYEIFKNGEEALDYIKKSEIKPDILLTDVIMPNMSGKELGYKIKEYVEGINVIYMSGYTDNVIIHHGELDKDIIFLPKPFTISELSQKILLASNK